MKAFWWLKEGSIAGMARPGFNCSRWFQFSFDEATVVGWLGRFTSGSRPIEDFQEHVRIYSPKISKFYDFTDRPYEKVIEVFNSPEGIAEVFGRTAEKTKILERFEVSNGAIDFRLSNDRLNWELESLRRNGIDTVVSLTEEHHSKERLAERFDAHHVAIEDLNAPQPEQVHRLAELLRETYEGRRKIVVHCLAGIGRTSTMLMAAHIVLGESVESMMKLIARQNPYFILTGRQEEFIRDFAAKHG